MANTFVIGDIHGAFKALKQCLLKSDFNYEEDMLICLGDVCDGWPQTKECINELLYIKYLTMILGNHDYWTLEWMRTGIADATWKAQGGDATLISYADNIPNDHYNFLQRALPYYIINNTLFVHAGIDATKPINKQGLDTFLWTRALAYTAIDLHSKNIKTKITDFDEVYIGHTPVNASEPIQGGEVWLMDTGAGWSGVLSMMNIDTKEIFTSDHVDTLYPGITGRIKRNKR